MDEHLYAYAAPSHVDGAVVSLATSGGVALLRPTEHPFFFRGFLTRPDVAALALRTVAAIAATSFAERRDPPSTVYDPVVTAHDDRLRFESFSSCGGVQARFDLLPDGYDGEILDRGTTNVDVNEPLRRYLSRVRRDDTLRLTVGDEGLRVTGTSETHFERRVSLPSRWLRGFAEVQAIASTFEPRSQVSGATAAAFLRRMPANGSGWVVPAAGSWRISGRPSAEAVYFAGADRIGVLLPLLRHATRVVAHGPASTSMTKTAPSAWKLELPGGRFVLALSSDPFSGFSGEGAVLGHLASEHASDDADLIHALLAYEPKLDLDRLSERSGLSGSRVRAALTVLATAGRVGYDVAEASYFHRELPYDAGAIEVLNPRLRGARALLADGGVRVAPTSDGEDVTEVVSGEQAYRVRRGADGSYACTCPWWTTHRGDRGPCKHVLAVRTSRGELDAVG